jgi:hypothetical protein
MIFLVYLDGSHDSVAKIMGRYPSAKNAEGARKRLIDRAAMMGTSAPTILIVNGKASLQEGTALKLSSVSLLG